MGSRTVRPSRLTVAIVLSLATAAAAQQPLPTARVGFTGDPAPGTGANYAAAILLPEGTGGQDGRATVLNEAGQLVYTLQFEEGFSGVFVTTIPEPGAAGRVLLVSATLLGSRRWRR